MKKKHTARNVILIVLAVAIVGGAAWFVYASGSGRSTSVLDSYNVATASVGTIQKTVFGSGPVEASDKVNVKADVSGEVLSVNVEKGQTVKAGDLLMTLSDKTLKDEIDALKTQVKAKEAAVNSSRAVTSSNITSPIAGRVMEIYISSGEDITAQSGRDESIMLLSADGKMNLRCNDADLAMGDQVDVEINGKTVKGYVTALENGQAVIIIDTDEFAPGTEATITKPSGDKVTANELNVNAPYYLRGYSGVVKSISVKELDKISVGTTLIKLEKKQYPTDYTDKLNELESARQDLKEAEEKLDQLDIKAEADGVINTVAVKEGDTVMEGMHVAVISNVNRMKLAISVDEVDILSIAVGQNAKIRFDAYPETTIDAKVEEVSRAGTIVGDVTSYPVYVYFDGGNTIFEGMHASADIEISREENSVIVPIEAIVSEGGEKFVRVPSGTDFQNVPVTLGIVNEVSAQIVSGIDANTEVLVPKTSSGTGFFMGGGMGGMGGGTRNNSQNSD